MSRYPVLEHMSHAIVEPSLRQSSRDCVNGKRRSKFENFQRTFLFHDLTPHSRLTVVVAKNWSFRIVQEPKIVRIPTAIQHHQNCSRIAVRSVFCHAPTSSSKRCFHYRYLAFVMSRWRCCTTLFRKCTTNWCKREFERNPRGIYTRKKTAKLLYFILLMLLMMVATLLVCFFTTLLLCLIIREFCLKTFCWYFCSQS